MKEWVEKKPLLITDRMLDSPYKLSYIPFQNGGRRCYIGGQFRLLHNPFFFQFKDLLCYFVFVLKIICICLKIEVLVLI